MTQIRKHRGETGRAYAGLTEHAAPGVHEFVATAAAQLLNANDAILEVGAGHGALSRRLRDLGFSSVTTTDLNPPEGAGIGHLDVLSVPPAGPLRTYRGVLAVEVLEHVDSPGSAITNLSAMLEPGGILIVSTPNATHPYSRLRYLLRGSPFLFDEAAYWSTGHVFPVPYWLLEELCRSAGLTVTSTYRVGSFELGRLKKAIIWLLSAPMYRLGLEKQPDQGDGVVTVVVARR